MYTFTRKLRSRLPKSYIMMFNMYNIFYIIRTVQCDIIMQCRPTKCASIIFNLLFHNIFYMYMFRTPGIIFKKTVATSTGTVWWTSVSMVHPGSSKYGSPWFIKVWFTLVHQSMVHPGSSKYGSPWFIKVWFTLVHQSMVLLELH